MKKKPKFPKHISVLMTDDADADPIAYKTPAEIGEQLAGELVATYELLHVGKLSVVKTVVLKLTTSPERNLRKYAQTLSTKELQQALRDYAKKKKKKKKKK